MLFHWLVLCVNLIQAIVIWEEGASIEEMPSWDPTVRQLVIVLGFLKPAVVFFYFKIFCIFIFKDEIKWYIM